MRHFIISVLVATSLAFPAPEASAKAKKMSKADWKRTVRPPPWKLVKRLAKTVPAPRVQPYSKRRALGGTRFAVVVGLRKRAKDHPKLVLVVLDKDKGSWRAEKILLADYTAAAKKVKLGCIEQHASKDPKRVLVSLYTQDYDWDGKPEVKVRHRLAGCDTPDPNTATPDTRLQILNVAPLAVALDVTLKIGEGPEEHDQWTAKIDHRADPNKDGHPDVTIVNRGEDFACQLGELTITTIKRTYHYVPASDRFKLITKRKTSRTKQQASW